MVERFNPDGVLIQNSKGHEVPDSTPMEIPAGFKRPESLQEMVQRLVRHQVSEAADAAGHETFEESEDFEVDDFFDPSSPYEEVFDPVLQRGITLDEFRRNEAVYRQRYEDAQERAWRAMDTSDALRARPRRLAEPSGARRGPPRTGKEVVDNSAVSDGSSKDGGSQ